MIKKLLAIFLVLFISEASAYTFKWIQDPAGAVYLDILKRKGFEMPRIYFAKKAILVKLDIMDNADTSSSVALAIWFSSKNASAVALSNFGYRSWSQAELAGTNKIVDAQIEIYHQQFVDGCVLATARLLIASGRSSGWVLLYDEFYSVKGRILEISDSGIILKEKRFK